MDLRLRPARAPLVVPIAGLCGGAVLTGSLTTPPEAVPWLLAWLFWPAAAAAIVEIRPGDRTGLILTAGAFAPSGALLYAGTQPTASELVAASVLSPAVIAVLVLLPVVFPRDDPDRRRLFLVGHALLVAALAALAGLSLAGRLTPAALYVGAAVVAIAPFGFAWVRLVDAVPALDLAVARGAAALLVLAVPAAAYVAAVALLAATDVPQQEAAGAVLAAVVALALLPAWVAVRRRLLARVYGAGRTPGSALAELARRLRQPTDPDAILDGVTDSVARAFRSPHAHIEAAGERAGDPRDAAARVPLVLGDRALGTLVVAARRPGERFTRGDIRVLEDLAPPVALLVEAVQLGHRLAAEQRRTLALRERERARIRDELHDRLGPLLAGLSMHTAAARRAGPDPGDHLDQLRAGLEECRDEVRRLVHEMRVPRDPVPLVGALHALVEGWQAAADGTGPRFELSIEGTPEVPARVGAVLERVAGEAITNVVRHAGAARCRLTLATRDGAAVLTIEDDGRGVEGGVPGVGITSMRSRLAAVGGGLAIAGRAGGGTVVTAAVPWSP